MAARAARPAPTSCPAASSSTCTPATPATRWCRGGRWGSFSDGRPKKAGTGPGTPRSGLTSTSTSGSRSTSRSSPASTTFAPGPSSRPLGLTSSRQETPSTCLAGTAYSRPTGACSIRTPSTPAASSPPAAPTTFSTSPRSAGKRSGRSPRDAASPRGPQRPTSHRESVSLVTDQVELHPVEQRAAGDRTRVGGPLARRLQVLLAGTAYVGWRDGSERHQLERVDLARRADGVPTAGLHPWPAPQPEGDGDVARDHLLAQLRAEVHLPRLRCLPAKHDRGSRADCPVMAGSRS